MIFLLFLFFFFCGAVLTKPTLLQKTTKNNKRNNKKQQQTTKNNKKQQKKHKQSKKQNKTKQKQKNTKKQSFGASGRPSTNPSEAGGLCPKLKFDFTKGTQSPRPWASAHGLRKPPWGSVWKTKMHRKGSFGGSVENRGCPGRKGGRGEGKPFPLTRG